MLPCPAAYTDYPRPLTHTQMSLVVQTAKASGPDAVTG